MDAIGRTTYISAPAGNDGVVALQLLERGRILDRLDELASDSARIGGRFVALAGPAGVGKTSVVDTFLRAQQGGRVFVGHCDSLSTPRPFGPVRDIQAQIGSGLSQIDEYRTQHDLFEDMLRMVNRRPAPVIVANEDAHWADQATLDALAYLGRRITETAGLVDMTYRDDESPPEL